MFAGGDGEIDFVEDDAVSGGYRDVAHVEEGCFRSFVLLVGGIGGVKGVGGHPC